MESRRSIGSWICSSRTMFMHAIMTKMSDLGKIENFLACGFWRYWNVQVFGFMLCCPGQCTDFGLKLGKHGPLIWVHNVAHGPCDPHNHEAMNQMEIVVHLPYNLYLQQLLQLLKLISFFFHFFIMKSPCKMVLLFIEGVCALVGRPFANLSPPFFCLAININDNICLPPKTVN